MPLSSPQPSRATPRADSPLRAADGPETDGPARARETSPPSGGAAGRERPGRGLLLGQYRILGPLGAGGMGRVYKAEHVLMKRLVAVKVMAPGPADDPASAAAFCQEVQAAARLNHPNIVLAFDANEAGGLRYLVMEYVDGIDLARLVAEAGPLPVPLACECVRQAALGLQYAHEYGLVHRDVKPSNLLIQGGGAGPDGTCSTPASPRVKVLDLGLARFRRGDESPDQRGLAGTPDYLAPEVAQDARAAGVRSDLYSLGCTLYQLLTGRVPFPGGTWTEKLLRHRLDPPTPVSELRPEVAAEVVAVVERLLAKDPAERYAEPADLAAELGVWLEKEGRWRTSAARARGLDTPLSLGGRTWPDSVGDVSPRGPPLVAAPLSVESPAGPPRTRAAHVLLRRVRRRLPLPAGILAAVLVGLLVGWAVQQLARHAPAASAPAPALPEPASLPPFAIEARSLAFDRLADAVAAAQDGDTILVRGDGPFTTPPLDLRGKALTVRAAADCRPRLRLAAGPAGRFWQPLFGTDRELTLEGLDLCCPDGPSRPGPTHLVYSEGAAVHLRGCRLLVPGHSAAVVCRNPPEVELRDCRLAALDLALCVEVGNGTPATVRLENCSVRIDKPDGAALSLWSPEVRRAAGVRLELVGNRVEAGRIVAFTAVPDRIEVEAHRNDFTFREALLSYAGFGGESWRRATAWRGDDNTCRGTGPWLRVDGKPVEVKGPDQWQTFWVAVQNGPAD